MYKLLLLAGGVALLNTPDFRKAATQIGNTESYHSGIIRTLLYSVINETPAYNNTVAQITSAIVAVLNQLSGTPQLKYTLTNDNGVSLSNVDSSGSFLPSMQCSLHLSTSTDSASSVFPCSANSPEKMYKAPILIFPVFGFGQGPKCAFRAIFLAAVCLTLMFNEYVK